MKPTTTEDWLRLALQRIADLERRVAELERQLAAAKG